MDRSSGTGTRPGGRNRVRRHQGGGASTRQNDAFRFDTLSEDLPIIAEVVDAPETLDQFLAAIGPYVKAGLATPETAQIKLYRFEP